MIALDAMHLQGPELIAICFGVYLLVSREWVARSALEFDYHAFGLNTNVKWYEWAAALGGIGFIALGLLAVTGIVALQPLR